MTFTVDYFIAKFEAIPEEKWCTGVFENHVGQKCALGLCGGGITNPEATEAYALTEIFEDNRLNITSVNDSKRQKKYHQPTPKQRVLAALRDIKEGK